MFDFKIEVESVFNLLPNFDKNSGQKMKKQQEKIEIISSFFEKYTIYLYYVTVCQRIG